MIPPAIPPVIHPTIPPAVPPVIPRFIPPVQPPVIPPTRQASFSTPGMQPGRVPPRIQNPFANPQGLNLSAPTFSPGGLYGPAPTGGHHGQATGYTPDAWIFDINNPNVAKSPASNQRPPRTEVQKFDGNPRSWPMFIASFKIMIHDTLDCDAARLTHLRSCLTPEIQRHLGEALINPGLYQFALTELQRKFGNPQIVAQA